jgi:MoxR-like ATPase
VERLSLARPPAPEDGLERAAELGAALVDELRTAVRAPVAALESAVVCLLSGGHLIIEDVPGVGKTVLAKSLARAAGCGYARLQCTADLLPSDVTGVSVWDQAAQRFSFRPGPVFANLLLVDEVNRASPKTQSALLESMEEGQVTVDGETRPLPRPFMVVATQNPVEYEGTFPLPEAQLDRFAMRLSLGYPDPQSEAEMLLDLAGRDPVASVRAVAGEEELRQAIDAVRQVHLDPEIARYVVALAHATRIDSRLVLGASPRAGLIMVRAARARALVEGRDFVLPEDVKALAPMVLGHRLVPGPEARGRGVSAGHVVEDLLARVPVPR